MPSAGRPRFWVAAYLASLLLTPAQADTHSGVVDLFAQITSALSDDNAAGFLKGFDSKMPDYAHLKTQITAMLQNAEVANSVEALNDEGDESKRKVDLDWYLEIRSRTAGGPLIRRREKIHCQIEKEGKHWRIVSLKPVAFFDAPAY
ncbi:MAG: hypothetical protein ACR2NN_02040 [Bryobacteraceae bacterium]